MTTSFRLADMTVHRIIEQEVPFFSALEVMPDLNRPGFAGGCFI
ncbi:hypothetical protein [Phreatobacter stygius]|nr:hypothetical protein [Phreatobacter stygius]